MSEAFRISPLKDEHMARMRAACAQNRQPKDPHGLPARTWARMDLRVRSVLVMLVTSEQIDPREKARKPWGEFSDADRHAIAALARTMRDNTQDAACLF